MASQSLLLAGRVYFACLQKGKQQIWSNGLISCTEGKFKSREGPEFETTIQSTERHCLGTLMLRAI